MPSRPTDTAAGLIRRLAPALLALIVLALPSGALAKDTRTVFVMDRCEPESFDAAVEPGTCVRNGGVTFDKFVRRLNPDDGGHNAWRFGPPQLMLKAGQAIVAKNTGGETHSFTEVANFGIHPWMRTVVTQEG